MSATDLTHVEWRKSSRSAGDANNCVEIARTTWRKSTRSSDANNCVEIARSDDWAAVRDSKDPSGPVLLLPAAEFDAFLVAARAGALTA